VVAFPAFVRIRWHRISSLPTGSGRMGSFYMRIDYKMDWASMETSIPRRVAGIPWSSDSSPMSCPGCSDETSDEGFLDTGIAHTSRSLRPSPEPPIGSIG
jgi:hypothetical protein